MPENHQLNTFHDWDSKLSLASSATNSHWPLPSPSYPNSARSETFTNIPFTTSTTTLTDQTPTRALNQHTFPSFKPSKRHRSHATLAPWKFEITASIISLLSMLGLVILLQHFDGQEYREWPYNFTLNGVVAIWSTICHTAVMVPVGGAISQAAWLYYLPEEGKGAKYRDLERFETFNDASRGAFGSLKLLWQVRGRNLVAIGALITVLCLAFDTFTQQVLSLESRSIAGNGAGYEQYSAGRVPRSTYLIDYDHGSTFSEFIPTLSTKAAIYNGILAQDIQPPTVSCSTGNCTWPTIPSLAVCGECSPSRFTTACNETYCNYTMPTGTIFTSPIQARTSNPLFEVSSSQGLKYNASSTSIAYIGTFDAIGSPWGSRYAKNTSIAATECALWMCVQAYNISSSNALQTQQTIGNWSDILPMPSSHSDGDTSAAPLSQASVTANRTFANLPASMNPVPGNYSVYGLSIVAMSRGLSDVIPGSVTGGTGTKYYSSAFIESIWNNTNSGSLGLDFWIKRLALSMTNNIRSSSSSSPASSLAPEYAGVAYHSQYFVKVRWEWLSLPIALVVASVLFLVLSIVRSARAGAEVFKGSPLALLFSEIDTRIAGRVRTRTRTAARTGMGTMGEVGRKEKMRVVLREEDGKWLFKEA